MSTNLPTKVLEDSAAGTKLFFDAYGILPLEFPSTDVDAAVSFFTEQGFDKEAATQIAATILKQSKLDEIPIYQILEQLKKFNGIQLNVLLAEILNNNRPATSSLGVKVLAAEKFNQTRNILA